MSSTFEDLRQQEKHQLFLEANRGNLTRVQEILLTWLNWRAGVSINEEDYYGATLLHRASQHNHLSLAKWLIENGANVHASNYFGETPLHRACYEGHLEIAKFLLENGGADDVDVEDDWYGSTLLHWACDLVYQYPGGHVQAVAKRFEIAKLLIEHGADVNNTKDGGVTPLHRACYQGRLETIKLLIENGADINAKESCEGGTPFLQLMLGKQFGRIQVACGEWR